MLVSFLERDKEEDEEENDGGGEYVCASGTGSKDPFLVDGRTVD